MTPAAARRLCFWLLLGTTLTLSLERAAEGDWRSAAILAWLIVAVGLARVWLGECQFKETA